MDSLAYSNIQNVLISPITYIPNRNKTKIMNTLETEEESSSQFKSVTDEVKEDSKSTERNGNEVKVSKINIY
jgi:hypothetical protein